MTELLLASVFLASLDDAGERADGALEAALEAIVEDARRSRPGVELAAIPFAVHLGLAVRAARAAAAAKSKPVPSLHGVLAELRATGRHGDLFLAAACGGRDRGAIEVFERDFIARVPGFLRRLRGSDAIVAEVVKEARCHLLTEERGRPRILDYRGRGSLASWLRVTCTRIALDHLREVHVKVDLDEAPPLPARRDAELDLLEARYLGDFKIALRAAFRSLEPAQRNLLRLKYGEGLPQKQIAASLRLDGSTVSRRLDAAYRQVFRETKRLLRERLRITSAEFASIEHALASRLDVTLSGVLEEPI